MNVVQRRVGYRQHAGPPAGALPVEVRQNVGGTTDTSVVLSHAAPEPDATVASCVHQDHLVIGATCIEVLPLAVLPLLWHKYTSVYTSIPSALAQVYTSIHQYSRCFDTRIHKYTPVLSLL